jgi:hypothetical protein
MSIKNSRHFTNLVSFTGVSFLPAHGGKFITDEYESPLLYHDDSSSAMIGVCGVHNSEPGVPWRDFTL